MEEAWLRDPRAGWQVRFHKDQRTWGRETLVFVDTGKAMPDHLPLLKERYHLRRADARLLWEGLMAQGWLKTRPAWGVYAEP